MNNIDDLLKIKNIKLTKQQYEAAMHTSGPALALAVPGAGKTTVIMARIANLMKNHNVKGENILAITFSKSSAVDMTKRFNNLFGSENLNNVKFSTIHAFGNWVVSSYNKRFNIISRLITATERINIIKSTYYSSTKKYLSDDALESYTTAMSYIKNKMLNDSETLEYIKSTRIEALNDVINAYEEYKKQNNLYDYDDMLVKCIDILNNNKVTLEYLQNKYQYIIIDEAQDTSLLQYEIISTLVKNRPDDKKNVYMVGDDDQNIYGFRGVDNTTILNIEKMFPGIKTYYMENNFRSQSFIVETSNSLIKNNKNRYNKVIQPIREASSKVEIIQARDIKSQTKYILDNIDDSSKSIAILYRNNISAVSLANDLLERNINFCASNYKPGFFNHWIVKDILSFVNVILDESDINSFSNIYYKIESYLSKKIILDAKNNRFKYNSLFDYLLYDYDLPKNQRESVLYIKRAFKEAKKKKANEGLRRLLSLTGYFSFLSDKASDLNVSSSSLTQIADMALDIIDSVENYADIKSKFNLLNEELNKSRFNINSRIHLSTLHSSKGLEFDKVFIVNVNDGIIPSSPDRIVSKEEALDYLESERRLFFVGITRAKNNLSIISTGNTSRFIEELEQNKTSTKKIILK